MSFSIIQDPMDPSSVKVFNSLLDIYDPRVNILPHDQSITWQGWVNVLKSVYTRSNLASHPEFFTSYTSPTDKKIINTIWNLVPDEDLWLLAYVTYAGSNRKLPYLYMYNVYNHSLDDWGASRLRVTDAFMESEDNYDTSAWGEKFLRNFQAMKATFSAHLSASVLSQKVSKYGNFGGNANTEQLGKMLCNLKYILEVTSGEFTTARTFLDRMSSHNGDGIDFSFHAPESGAYQPSYRMRITRKWREPLYKVLSYTTNPLKILPYPLISKGEHSPALFGVELEVSTNYDVRKIIDAGHEPFMLAKQDSSVTGSKRFPMELVTVPMSMKAHKKEWAHWFSKLDYMEFDCTTETSNGMHVHIDRKAFSSPAHINSLCWFVTCPANKDFMLLLSERTASSMAQWSPSPNYPSQRTLLGNYKRATDYCSTIRGAVNLSKPATVEIRIFRGIVSYASVLKNLEVVDAMLQFTHHRSYSQLTLRHFLSWLKMQPLNKYQVLRKFLQINDIDNLLYMSDIKNVIGNLTDPEAIVTALNKSGLPLTGKLVTYLNKGKKRTFVLDKATGLLTCVIRNKGKVSFLDRQLEARYLRGHNHAA